MRSIVDFGMAVFVVSAFCSYVYLWLRKRMLWEYLQIHADKWAESITGKRTEHWNEYFSCVLCVGFLLAFAVSIVAFIVSGFCWWWLAVPFCCPALIRRWT